MTFSYLLAKIRNADVASEPFRHIHVNHFFRDEDFRDIVSAPDIAVPPQSSDEQLFQTLFESGYKIIDFPGSITDKDIYIRWHRDRHADRPYHNSSCEGFGVTLRLTEPKSGVITDLMAFLNGRDLQETLADKFEIKMGDVSYDAGIQKYLDGYEISPHPDTRKKALTFMVNVNPGARSEEREHHTHYLQFRDAYKYVQTYWEGNPDKDRCWVPWDWCDSKKIQRENNSIVVFSPDNDTIHAVKAHYDHLACQRTQLYGNLWYHERQTGGTPAWEDFVVRCANGTPQRTLTSRVASVLPRRVRSFVKNRLTKDTRHVIQNHLKRD